MQTEIKRNPIIVQISSTSGTGSIGKICKAVSALLDEKSVENYILYSMASLKSRNAIKYSNKLLLYLQGFPEKLLGNSGFGNHISTYLLLRNLRRIRPTIVHLHNLHSHDVNLPMLFNYLRKNRIKVFWTFHDCWAFTGGCVHFDGIGCSKWMSNCYECPIYKRHSYFFDRTSCNYKKKKSLYAEGVDMTIITPSNWLGTLVKRSFLKDYPVIVMNNGIDLSTFRPTTSDFRKKYNLENKHIILGVAFGWSEKKGLDIFIKLAKKLDATYNIILVGTNDEVDKILPDNIISIHRTNNQEELVYIYSAADVFLQLSREENFPTVNIEALACGTPVITFDIGGSPEIIDDSCGYIIDKTNFDELVNKIEYTCQKQPFPQIACVKRAGQFNQIDKFKSYLNLYKVE